VVYAARYLTSGGGRRIIGSFIHGSMANALPQAVGAQAAYPDRQVVTLSGDGGLTMLLGELLTLTQNKLPVKVVVLNNSSLNFVELEVKAAGYVNVATDLENPDLAAVAEAMGLKGIRVERSKDLPGAIREILAHDGPALLDVVTEREELTIPPSFQAEQVKGVTLYAIRTVLSGRGDELLALARANCRHLLRARSQRQNLQPRPPCPPGAAASSAAGCWPSYRSRGGRLFWTLAMCWPQPAHLVVWLVRNCTGLHITDLLVWELLVLSVRPGA